MVSTRTGREPMSTADLAPSDDELYPGGWFDLGLEFKSPRGVDPGIVADDIEQIIIDALHDSGREDIAEMLR